MASRAAPVRPPPYPSVDTIEVALCPHLNATFRVSPLTAVELPSKVTQRRLVVIKIPLVELSIDPQLWRMPQDSSGPY